MKGPCIF
jgi:transposase